MTVSRENVAFFDRYTPLHMVSGVALGRLGLPWWGALAIAVAWEVAEPSLKRSPVWRKRFPNPTIDSFGNKSGDVAALMGTWYLARRR